MKWASSSLTRAVINYYEVPKNDKIRDKTIHTIRIEYFVEENDRSVQM